MKVSFNISKVLFFSGLIAVFVLVGVVLAQEIDKEKAVELVQQFGGPGGCDSEESCRTFCDNSDNFETCINWAKENSLISSEEAEKVEKIAKVGKEFLGPGGCRSHEECERFCSQPQNQDICMDFAVQQGFLTSNEAERIREFRRQAEEEFEVEIKTEIDPEFDKDRAQQILETQGGPGGCQTMEECEDFCEEPQNQEACFAFAERHGLFKNREAVEKIRKIIEEGGPGGCRGEVECRAFCENPDNFEVCINFAEEHDFIKSEEVEKARRGAKALKEGGPGSCKGPKECEAFCSSPDNQEVCFEWAKKHGFISEEQIRMMEELKTRSEEQRREFEKRDEEIRGQYRAPLPGLGNTPPPDGFQPPGFGGTPPPEHTPEFTIPSEFEAVKRCTENGGFWTGSTCEFPNKELTPAPTPELYQEEESILQNTGAYIRGAFRDFFFK